MKSNYCIHILRFSLLFVIAILPFISAGQTFEIRLDENELGYMEVQMRETSGIDTPDPTSKIIDITFSIKWPLSFNADVFLLCEDNSYNLLDGLNGRQSNGSYHYKYWNADLTPFSCPHTWVVNEWQTLAQFYVTGDAASCDFEIANHLEFGRYLNWNQNAKDLEPLPNGILNYKFPTIVYNRVWVGGASGNEKDWYISDNWIDECEDPCAIPTISDNVLIPDVSGASGFFPEQMLSDEGMYCNNIFLRVNSHLYVPTLNGNLLIAGELKNYGEVRVQADADVTVAGDTYIDKHEGMFIKSTAEGTGSFMDNGTISYGPSGSVIVETFLPNSAAAPGTFYFHQVGPSVDSPYYTPVGTGMFLGSFDINILSTWAYQWLEPIGEWSVIYWYFHEIPTTKGFILSTIDQTDHIVSMMGKFITGNVETIPMTFGGSNLELICNPYPTSVDFDAISADNSWLIESNYKAWDPSGSGNYATYSTESGGTNGATQYIQVGQSVFFQTKNVGTFEFNNSYRNHDNGLFFKSSYINRLVVAVNGSGFSDEVIIHFMDSATTGLDSHDIVKWESMIPEAVSLRCVEDGDSELTINALPTSTMETMYSIPLLFSCSDTASYTLSLDGVQSFSNYTEIWLEDLKEGGNWIDLISNPEYYFAATAVDSSARFILHFFDPTLTGIEEQNETNEVHVFSYGQEVYIMNKTDNPIISYSVFSVPGSQVVSMVGNSDFVNKVTVNGSAGYYFVRVIMSDRVYLEKVFIE